MIFSAMFTLLAGHETTMNMIGNGMLACSAIPTRWRACDQIRR